MVGISVLQGDVREHSLALEVAGARPVVMCCVADLDEVPDHRLDSLMIPEGESTTVSTLLVAFEILVPLHELIDADLPAYRSYVGMIMLAGRVEGTQEGQALLDGVDMTVRHDASGQRVDFYEEDLIAPELSAGLDRPLHAIFIRAPWAEEVDPGVEILTTTYAGRTAEVDGIGGSKIVAVRQGSLLATSFRPEVGGDHQVHSVFVSMVIRRA